MIKANPLAILFVIDDMERSHAFSHSILNLSRSLQEQGHKCVIAGHFGDFEHRVKRSLADHYNLQIPSGFFSFRHRARQVLRSIIVQHKIDLIDATGLAATSLVHGLARKTHTPTVLTFTNDEQKPFARQKWRSAINVSQAVISTNPRITRWIKDSFPTEISKVNTINRGIDIANYHESSVSGSRLHTFFQETSVLDDKEHRDLILCCTDITKPGVDQFIDALSLLRELNPDLKFLAVVSSKTDKKAWSQLRSRVEKAKLSRYIRFVQHLSDRYAAYKAVDVIVDMLSPDEVVIPWLSVEALASSRRVLAMRNSAGAQFVRHRRCGWIVRPDDPLHLAQNLNEALSSPPDLRKKMEQSALETITKYCSLDQMAQRTLRLYQNVVHRYNRV